MQYDLTDISTIKKLMSGDNARFSKSLGQNFLIDDSVCPKMAELCGVDKSSGVIEIGTGVGVLTVELCKRAKRVVALEIDSTLFPVLDKTLADFDNVEVINADVLKTDLKQLIAEKFGDMPVYVCANLPYYITSPVIMKLLEEKPGIAGITVMVQREAGERFCAEVGSRLSSAVTVAAEYYADREELFDVDRSAFLPSPKVDSRVIRLTPKDKYTEFDKEKLFAVVKAGFAQRRKTLINSLCAAGVTKEQIKSALHSCDIPETARIEELDMGQLGALSRAVF